MMFTAVLFPGKHKVVRLTAEGVYEHAVSGNVSPGIWVFREHGLYATRLRPATIHEKTELFNEVGWPRVGVFPVAKTSVFFCMPINRNQYRKHIPHLKVHKNQQVQLLPLLFAPDNISLLDPLYARVPKAAFPKLIYEDINDRYPLEQIDALRAQINDVSGASRFPLGPSAATPELFEAYNFIVESAVPPLEKVAKESLRLAGATLVSLKDEGNGQYRVTYEFEGLGYSVLVDDNLTVLDAGICLNGRDSDFDLSSIVFVVHKSGVML